MQHLPSTYSPPSVRSPASVPSLPSLPAEMNERLAEIRRGLTKVGPGKYTISQPVALTGDERDWLAEFVQISEEALAFADHDDRYARLERFSFGFAQLRSVDAASVRGTILNWCEATEDYGLVILDRACRMWNGRKFPWQKPGLVPNPDELARACSEAATALRGEMREMRNILAAEVVKLLPPLTDEQRAANLKALSDLKIELVEVASVVSASRETTPVPQRYAPGYLDELKAREAKRLVKEAEARAQSDLRDLEAKSKAPETQESAA